MSFSGEVTGILPDIGIFGFWERHAFRYIAGSPNFGLYLARKKD